MAISLTTDGLNLDYRTEPLTGPSGTFPIGTVISTGFAAENIKEIPGTWARLEDRSAFVGAPLPSPLAIRVL